MAEEINLAEKVLSATGAGQGRANHRIAIDSVARRDLFDEAFHRKQ